ncbi:hypothetical protein EZJ49_15865 [Bdellovibrio bacteriovorus]|uniref:hypothetical protein n=1 Tax=Bdellovibrio bacteriovorus TaxID=959 RepID=UPI0021D1498B|nr:hypothetical protein [Bdellovibrio bacteriovorus]UXR64546.1 hypothetical protein EZJ49_15865 [Bdellovibrio bacteriovorus]
MMVRLWVLFAGILLTGCTLDAEMLRRMEQSLKTPEVVLTSSSQDNTNISPIMVSAEFSSEISGFDAEDLNLINGTAIITGSGKSYLIAITPQLAGVVSVSVKAGSVTGTDGYGNSPSNTLQKMFDDVRPTPPVISNSPSAATPDTSPAISWTGASDGHSGIHHYEIALGTTAGSDNLVAWDITAESSKTFESLTLQDGVNYYASVRVTDNAGNVSTIVSGPAFQYQAPLTCPLGYVRVPALAGYSASDFCVMKYEAKQDGTKAVSTAAVVPWGNLTRAAADAACKESGSRYSLITNYQWQTIARNIADVDANWSGGVAYSGEISRGHSDSTPFDALVASTDDNDGCAGTGQTCNSTVYNNQRRTHVLSNGEVIWDFAGNRHEMVLENDGFGTTNVGGYVASLTAGDRRQSDYGNDTVCAAPASNNYCGFGKHNFYDYNKVVIRGGNATYGDSAGIFAAYMGYDPAYPVGGSVGFRCTYK